MKSPYRFGLLVVALAWLALPSSGIAAGEEPPAGYELVEVSPSVAMAFHSNGSNITCVALDDGLVFFDASLSTRVARHFRTAMERRFDRPAAALVLTHAHLDHILGMGAFGDVPVWAAKATRPRWDHFLSVEWDDQAVAQYASVFTTLPDEIDDAELRLPTNWFDDETVLGTGATRVAVSRVGGHTEGSSAGWVTPDEVVISGDLVQARRRPYFGEPDTDFDAWIGALADWEARPAAAVCPGHGPVIDAAELGEIRAWFEAANGAMTKLKADGRTAEEIFAGDELPTGYWPEEDAPPRWWGYCVMRLYAASS